MQWEMKLHQMDVIDDHCPKLNCLSYCHNYHRRPNLKNTHTFLASNHNRTFIQRYPMRYLRVIWQPLQYGKFPFEGSEREGASTAILTIDSVVPMCSCTTTRHHVVTALSEFCRTHQAVRIIIQRRHLNHQISLVQKPFLQKKSYIALSVNKICLLTEICSTNKIIRIIQRQVWNHKIELVQ